MQKKIIALAIAGLASTAAFAQSNVTIYGSVDMGYAYRYDTINSKNHPISGIDGGQAQGNRLGFKGVEDLGNGLKAVFLVEQGLGLDSSSDTYTGNKSISFTRQAYVGLTGGFGTAIAGRLYSPHFSFVSAIDPFAAGTVGQYKNVYGNDVSGLTDPTRLDNAVAYVSPSFGGFTVTGAYSNNAAGQESAIDNSKNNTVYALLGRYQGAGVDAGVNLHRIAAASTLTTLKTVDNITIAGSYDAKVVKIAALYSYNYMDNVAASSDVRIENWMIGATIPVGKVAIKTSYMFSDGNTAAGGNAQQLALGANYSLSKRTDLYTAYAWIDNDSAKQSNGTYLRRAAVVGDASNSGMNSQQGFQVGVRHMF